MKTNVVVSDLSKSSALTSPLDWPYMRISPLESIMPSTVFDKIFDDFFNMKNSDSYFKSTNHGNVPYDVYSIYNENNEEIGIELKYALANYSKEEISISVEDSMLTISTVKSINEPTENTSIIKKCLYNGIKKSKWTMSYRLGSHVDIKNINSSFKDGILAINIPYKNKDKNVISIKID